MTTSTAGPEHEVIPTTPTAEQQALIDEAVAIEIDAANDEAERERLVEVLLHAAYPPHDRGTYPRHEYPHADLLALVDRSAEYGGLATFGEQLEDRRRMAARILDALTPELAPAPADDEDAPGQQPVHTNTLRRWAVWCDQIAEHADGRRRIATNGARFLADHIRIEIAHPLNRPDLDPAGYRDPSIFDADRQDPATSEEQA